MQYDMDKFEHRRAALNALIGTLGKGGISAVASRINKDASYVSRMRYPPSKAGFKRMGEDTVDLLNNAYPGWLAAPLVAEAPASWPPAPRHKNTTSSLAQAVEVIALHLNQIANTDKDAAKALLAALVSSPGIHGTIAASLAQLCAHDSAKQAAA